MGRDLAGDGDPGRAGQGHLRRLVELRRLAPRAGQRGGAPRNFLGLVSEQCIYNLLARTVELEVIPAAEAYGIGIIPWTPLAGGLLGGALRKVTEGRRGAERVQKPGRARADQLEP